ncbi:MAG: valine--tRNA ligase [Mycoplasmoidaceae bacterium]
MASKNNKKYDPAYVEAKVKKLLQGKDFYEYHKYSKRPNFSIVLPPPNITGKLHLGHAWDTSLQDAIIRYKHLQGFNTLWVSGMDHASIATQTKYEKILKETEHKSRFDFGRKEFLNKLQVWSNEQKQFIAKQWDSLNLALSLKSQCFTMDEHVHQACMEWFVDAYKQGLIYQDYKLVNWDTQLQTAISDIEVIYKETQSKMYYFKYHLQDDYRFLTVATTRPETMFGDVCLVINPKDPHNAKYIGRTAINPANGKPLPIIGDEYVELGFGTGIMKCTPAHDFNDYNLAKKHHITLYHNVMNPNGTMNQDAIDFNGLTYNMLSIKEAREKLVAALQEKGDLVKVEDIVNNIGYSERTNTVVEPFLSKQWFVKMQPLAKRIIEMQEKNKGVEFIPPRFNDALLTWLNNIQDWCISRQLWWGHRLPVYYHKETGKVLVTTKPPKDLDKWEQDPDVLDTWFSSGLWPLVCTSWREDKKYKDFYPTSLLVTAYDILFFWVARMMTMCDHWSKKLPFNQVLIHGLIRDAQGRKMSKSLGNGVDPMDLVAKYGSDAMKMFFTSSVTMGEDLRFNEEKITYYWSVLNKMWNSYNLISGAKIKFTTKDLNQFDCWMIDKLNKLNNQLISQYDKYDFTVANKALIDCFWNDYCNQYLEFIKINLNNKKKVTKQKAVALFIFDEFLKLFYPIAPAIADYLFYKINHKYIWFTNVKPLKIKCEFDQVLMKHFVNITNCLRDYRIKHSLSRKNEIAFDYVTNDKVDLVQLNNLLLAFNIKINNIINVKPENTNALVVEDGIICLQAQENKSEDLAKRLEVVEFEIKRATGLLANANFVAKAPAEKVQAERDKLSKYTLEKEQILQSLKK